MTFAVFSNILTMILCIAVLVQSVRLMRAFDAVKNGALTDVVHALDVSTGEARHVLGQLAGLLHGDLAVTARTISEGKAMIDELTVMTGIANAIAERIVDAAGASNGTRGDASVARVSRDVDAADLTKSPDVASAGEAPQPPPRVRRTRNAISRMAA